MSNFLSLPLRPVEATANAGAADREGITSTRFALDARRGDRE